MRPKKILIVHLDALFPKVMASQDTVFKMVKRLGQDHQVDLATTVRDELELSESRRHLAGVCHAFHPIVPINPRGSQWRRKFHALQYWWRRRRRHHPHHYFYAGHPRVMGQLAALVRQGGYDIVQAEYWYMAQLFPHLDPGIYRAVDTHDILFDKRAQEVRREYGDRAPAALLAEVEVYRRLEIQCLKQADLAIAVSAADQEALVRLDLGNDNLLVPVGQDVDYFQDRDPRPKENVVLFYGSMGGKQNIDGFFRFWRHIFPAIQAAVPDARVFVVGANPPPEIQQLHDGQRVTVTGFVDDVRGFLAQAKVMVVPLDVAAGFRSRTIEVMAMGVPVVGTHKALDSVQMQDGVHGYIADDDGEMAQAAIRLLRDEALRQRMAEAGRAFVCERYSIDATIGKLSSYYLTLSAAGIPPSRKE